jgi:hypothetical protein
MVVVGFWMLYDVYFTLGKPLLTVVGEEFTAGAAIVRTVMMFVGFFTLIRTEIVDFRRAAGQKPFYRRYFHLYALAIVGIFLYVGFMYGQGSDQYLTLLFHISTQGEAAAYSMIFFGVLTAMWRALRIRTLEAGLMVVAGLIVLFGNAPVFASMFPGVGPVASFWLIETINGGVRRAIYFGSTMGAITVTIRTLLAKEPAAMGAAMEEE